MNGRELVVVANRHRFRIDLGTPRGLPAVSFGLWSPLRLLGARATVDLLCCALAERKLLLHSANLANITPVAEVSSNQRTNEPMNQ